MAECAVEGVVGCVTFEMFDGMDLAARLDLEFAHPSRVRVPIAWRRCLTIAPFEETSEVIRALRGLDGTSDGIVRALLSEQTYGDFAIAVLVKAALPLAVARCGSDDEWLDDLVGDLALVIAEARRDSALPCGSGLLSRLLNRAWSRTRRRRHAKAPLPLDPTLGIFLVRADDGVSPEEAAVCRAEVDRLRAELRASAGWQRGAVRAWNTVVTLTPIEPKTNAQRARLKWARQVLRSTFATPSSVA